MVAVEWRAGCVLVWWGAGGHADIYAVAGLQWVDVLNDADAAACRGVLAMEQALLAYFKMLDPLCQWSARSSDPKAFLTIDDSVLAAVDFINGAHLSPADQRKLVEARKLRDGVEQRSSAWHLFYRSVHQGAEQLSTDRIEKLVRCCHNCCL